MVSTGPGNQEKSDKCLSAPPGPGKVQDFQKTCFKVFWEKSGNLTSYGTQVLRVHGPLNLIT